MLTTSKDLIAITTTDFTEKAILYEIEKELLKKFEILGKELASALAKQIIEKYDLLVVMKDLPNGKTTIGARLKLKSSNGK